MGAALRKHTHCCPQLFDLPKTDYGTVRHTEAEAGLAKQQKAAQEHPKTSQTLSRHSCERKKKQELFFEARVALPEPQKL